MEVTLQRPIATRRVRREATGRADSEVGGLLDRRDSIIPPTLYHHRSLAADPGHDGGPVFLIMASTRFTLLAATVWSPSQGLFSSVCSLTLLAGGMIHLVGFDRSRDVTSCLVGDSSIALPPAPPLTGAALDTHLPRDAPGGTQEAP